jgi:SAM-dependent methyltransferase
MLCKGCGSGNIVNFDIGRSSVSGYRCNDLSESKMQPIFDIVLVFCDKCNLVSQKRYEAADILLDKLYNEHETTQHNKKNLFFYHFAEKLIKKYTLNKNKKVLEIGSNCGLFLKILRDKSEVEVMGVEPSKTFQKLWKQRGLNMVNKYLNEESVITLQNHAPFNLIYLRHVYEHVPDPLEFIKHLSRLIESTGSIILEVPYLPSLIKFGRYENLSYSHLHFYSISSLDAIFTKYGMGLSEFELVSNDGGSIIAHFKRGIKTDNKLFEQNLRIELMEFLSKGNNLKYKVQEKLQKYNQCELVGYGAGAKGQHLIKILGLENFLSSVIDDTPGLKNKYIPTTSIKIVDSEVLKNSNIKAVINLAPTHLDVIRKKVPDYLEIIDFINYKY